MLRGKHEESNFLVPFCLIAFLVIVGLPVFLLHLYDTYGPGLLNGVGSPPTIAYGPSVAQVSVGRSILSSLPWAGLGALIALAMFARLAYKSIPGGKWQQSAVLVITAVGIMMALLIMLWPSMLS